MELKFVELDDIVRPKTSQKFREYIKVLMKHPGKWAEYPDKLNTPTEGYRLKKLVPGIEVRLTGGNNLAKKHPDKKPYTLYLRYVEPTELL